MSIFFLLWVLITNSTNSWGTIFPERSNTELFYIKDPAIDFAIRLELIADAKYSIDILSFSQAMDKTGAIFINAIRKAQEKRCVKVRYLYDSVASLLDRDFFNTSGKILSDQKLACPPNKHGEVITVGFWQKILTGLEWDDFIHEKVLLIDAGTPNEKLVIGGRGYTEFSRQVADSAFIFRPLDPAKPSFGSDVLTSFNELWTMAKTFSPLLNHQSEITIPEQKIDLEYFVTTPELKNQLRHLKTILFSPSSKAVELKNQFRPKMIQLTSNDLFKHVLQNSHIDREQLTNDNLNILINEIDQASSEISLASYSIAFPEILFTSFVKFIKRGHTLNLYTNGQEAHDFFVYQGTPVYYSFECLEKLILATKNSKGKLNIYFLNPTKAQKYNELPFVHRKLVQFNKTTFTGTDNFTWSSARKNDEWMVKIVDENLAQFLNEEESIQKNYYDLVTAEKIMKDNREATLLYKIFHTFIKNNY